MDDVSDDYDLLRRYAEGNDEAAFAVLVRRHTDMVYSAARRQVGAGAAADEVTQAAFVLLMRKAGRLPPGTVVAGWLYKAVRYTALNAQRAAARRRKHERKAGEMARTATQNNPHANPSWTRVAPLLDEAVARLRPADRSAVVLRYMERRSLAEVGQSLGVSEHAAQMRVTRALEKLRDIFRRRGVTMTAAALGVVVSAHATEAAPPALAGSLSVSALRTAGATPGNCLTFADGASRGMRVERVRVAVTLAVAAAVVVGISAGVARIAVNQWPAWHAPAATEAQDRPPSYGFAAPAVARVVDRENV